MYLIKSIITLTTLFSLGMTTHVPRMDPVTADEVWTEEVIENMTLDEKIGQLFMIRAHSDKGPDHIAEVEKYIRNYHVGGLCFFQGTPEKQASLTNRYQSISNVPLLIAMDAEWGLGMRFPESCINFPRQLMLGAIQNNNLIYEMGREVGRQLRRIGAHVNFAPVIDVNNNSKNPVINDRSFGEDRNNVTSKGFSYMRGLQDGGVLACAKHFPGHGDTDTDSHLDLPVIPHKKQRLDSIELMPFRMLSNQGLDAIMVAHLHIPELDDRPNRPTTLSRNVIQNLLIDQMGFRGLIFTDAMEMQGVTKHFKNGEAELEAFLAGNDFVVLPPDLPMAIKRIKTAVEGGLISMERLELSVRKILNAKFKVGLADKHQVLSVENIGADLNSNTAISLKAKLVEQAITLVENRENLVPIRDTYEKRFASIAIGANKLTPFQKRLEDYTKSMTSLYIPKDITPDQWQRVKNQVSKFDVVIVSLHDMSKYAHRNFGIHPQSVSILRELAAETKVVLTIFGSPYALKFFEGIPNILVAYDEDILTQDLVAQALFGVNEISGNLPVSASAEFPFGKSVHTPSLNRLGYSVPERVGLDGQVLNAIDTIVEEMINTKAAPGCQVLIAKDGKIVFHRSYGTHTYNKNAMSEIADIYDLASLTKILASTISVMKLQEEKKLNIYKPINKYLAEADTSNKKNLIIEDILSHHAGLKAWIPFYAETLDSSMKKPRPSQKYYRKEPSDSFSIKVAQDLYLRNDYRDSIWSKILGSELRMHRNYLYSDLGFYMMHEVIKRVSGKPIDQFVKDMFYDPLGLKSIGYNPIERLESARVVPTENDEYFRFQTLHGHVHDMGAAMLGGISGHAGLFSNSYDIAVIMQMLLNGGSYGGIKYLDPKTINIFTNRYYRSSRKAIGFDMKELNGLKNLNMSEKASLFTFGHTGFTGTAVYADPGYNIIYVFLANRTFPTMKNNKFGRNDYRPRVQTVIYDALKE